MMTATATADSAIFNRSRRRIAVWALALTLGGAAAGTVTTLAVTRDDNAVTRTTPTSTPPSSPSLNPASPDSYYYKLGPGPR